MQAEGLSPASRPPALARLNSNAELMEGVLRASWDAVLPGPGPGATAGLAGPQLGGRSCAQQQALAGRASSSLAHRGLSCLMNKIVAIQLSEACHNGGMKVNK